MGTKRKMGTKRRPTPDFKKEEGEYDEKIA